MRTLKLTLAYDGTDYAGWQIQPNRRTLQGTIEQTLAKITGEPIRVAASGRTDAGVHALGQVVSFRTESALSCSVFQRALNAELPEDIVITSAEEVADGFHATYSAVRKCYRYVIHDGPLPDVFLRRSVWHVHYRLNEAAMHQAGVALVGHHDFSSFETAGSPRGSSERTVLRLDVRRTAQDVIQIEVEADGFLYNMVRNIVGTLVAVGRGAKSEAWPAEVLAARNRRLAGIAAPPQGLVLVRVEYGNDS